jgi:DNA replication and repair protein RecF
VRLKQLKLENFKNYASLDVSLSPHLVCIVGLNGSGKTNLMDAIHYLIFTKSGFSANDPSNIKKGEKYFLTKGQIEESEASTELLCYLEKGQKKVLRKDKIAYDKLSEHIGAFQGVMCTPYDVELILAGSEVRRKWIDGCISQYEPDYLENLLTYQRYLKQRNALLKTTDGKLNPSNEALLNTYDHRLIPLARSISQQRAEFLHEFRPFFHANLSVLVQAHEACEIQLRSKVLDADFEKNYQDCRPKDLVMQRTHMGSHKDDFIFTLEGEPIKRFGSQGQQKSFLISLKLAQYDHLVEKTGRTPILLLDDIFDKLDDERIQQLLSLLTHPFSKKDKIKQKGQVFITDARAERSMTLTKNIPNTQILEIEAGNLVADSHA